MPSEAIKMRLASPDIGPNGILVPTPDRIPPMTMADVMELLRWVHEDLRKIHNSYLRDNPGPMELDDLPSPAERVTAMEKRVLELADVVLILSQRTWWSMFKDWVASIWR